MERNSQRSISKRRKRSQAQSVRSKSRRHRRHHRPISNQSIRNNNTRMPGCQWPDVHGGGYGTGCPPGYLMTYFSGYSPMSDGEVITGGRYYEDRCICQAMTFNDRQRGAT